MFDCLTHRSCSSAPVPRFLGGLCLVMALCSVLSAAETTELGALQRDGDVSLSFDGDVVLSGPVTVNGNLEIRARNIDVTGAVTVQGGRLALLPTAGKDGLGGVAHLGSGARLQAGEIRVGGDVQGHGALPHARTVRIDAGATLCADAKGSGAGGKVVVWSDEKTEFHGAISARGGPLSGDGGWVEVSSRGVLDFAGQVDTSAAAGHNGSLLLDPNIINIVGAMPDLNGDGTVGDDISAPTDLSVSSTFPGMTSVITVGALKSVLAGSDVTLASTIAVNWTAVMDIDGLGVAGRTLTITSAAITIQNGGVNDSNLVTPDKLNVTLTATKSLDVFGSLLTGGGNVILTAGPGSANQAIRIGATDTVDTAGGNLTINGTGIIEGVHVTTGAQLLAHAGALSITGTATGTTVNSYTHGIFFNGDTNITQAGNVTLLGTGANAGAGLFFEGAVHVESTAGSCSVTGTGAGRHGIFISDTSPIAVAKSTFFGGATGLTVTGNGTEFGLYTPGHGDYTDPNTMVFTPADYGTATFVSSAGPVTISGDATVAAGTTNGTGRHGFQVNGDCSITGVGNVSLSGKGTEFGVMVLQSLTVTSSTGTTAVTANSTGRHGLHAVSSMTLSGDQGVTVTANSTQFGIESNGAGSFTSANGPVSVTATTVVGPADPVLNAMVPIQSRGEGKRGIHLASTTVHGKGNVNVTASATEAAIDAGTFSVTSDSGTVTIDGQVTTGTGVLPGNAVDAIKSVNGAITVQAGGDVLVKARANSNGITAPGVSVTSTNGAVTLDTSANSIALKSWNSALTINAKNDVQIKSQGTQTGVEARGLSLTSTAGKVTVAPTGGSGIGNHLLHWSNGGSATIQAAGDITLSSPFQMAGDGLSATSTSGGIAITANSTNGGLKCGFQNVSLTAAKDIAVDLQCTQYEVLSSGAFTATSSTGAVSINSVSNSGSGAYGNVKVAGLFTATAAKDVNVTASGFAPFFSQGLALTSTTGKVTMAATSTETTANRAETLIVSGPTTVQAAGDISFTGTHGRIPMYLDGAASFTSTAGAVTVNGSLPSTSSGNNIRAGLCCRSAMSLQGAKDVSLTGRGAAFGVEVLNDLTLTSTAGKVTVLGDATIPFNQDSTGLEVSGKLTVNAQSDVSITGKSSMFGTKIFDVTQVNSTAGGITLVGDASAKAPLFSTSAYGVAFNTDSTLTARNDITITGKSGYYGIFTAGTPTYTSSAGKLTLVGDCNAATGDHHVGVFLGPNAALKAGGDLSVSGNGATEGLQLRTNPTFTSTGGGVSLLGDCTVNVPFSSRGRNGLDMGSPVPSTLTINAMGDISVTGKGGQYGIALPCVNTFTSTAGKITIFGDGTANNAAAGRYGIDLNALTASAATGISLIGKGTEFGVNLWGATPSLNTTGGTLFLSGDATATPANYNLTYTVGPSTYNDVPTGRHAIVAPAGTFTGGDGVTINGTASEFGLVLYGGASQINSTNGAVTVNVNASHPLPAGTITALSGVVPPEETAPDGRHGLATDMPFSISGKTGVNMTGSANVFALEFLTGSKIKASAGPVTLLGLSTEHAGLFSEADITGTGITATGISAGTDTGSAGIEINGGTVDGTSGLVTLNGMATSNAADVGGVKFSGGVVKTSLPGSGIQITGNSPHDGVAILAGATLDGGGNAVSISGTSNGAGPTQTSGIFVEDGNPSGAVVQSLGGNVTLTGTSNSGDGIRIGSAGTSAGFVDVGAGSLTLSADTVNLITGAAPSLRGKGGLLTIAPRTAGLPISVGGTGASGTVYLSQNEINEIKSGFASVTVGRTDGGALTVPLSGATGAAFSSSVKLLTGAQLDVVGPLTTLAGSTGGVTLQHGGVMTVESTGLVSGDGGVSELGAGAVILKNAVSSNNAPISITGSTTALDNLTLSAGTSTVTFRGQVSPGLSGPGKLNITGDLVFADSSAYFADIATPAAGGFDQIVASGKVTVGGKLLGSATGPYLPSDAFPIITNNSTSSVSGAFSNLTELGSVQLGATTLNGSYRAGDGNDVVLSTDQPAVITSPGVTPTHINTGSSVTVTAMINDPDNTAVTTVYNYGDGSSDSTGVHTYTTPGHYIVTISVNDGIFTTVTQFAVDVNAFTPFPAAISGTFGPAGSSTDSLKITGSVPYTAGTALTGKTFSLQLGSHSQTFTLRKSGAAISNDKKARISVKLPKKGASGSAKFIVLIRKVEYGDLLGQATTGTVPVILAVNFLDQTLTDSITLTIKKRGKLRTASGKFTN